MAWQVELHPAFAAELKAVSPTVRVAVLARATLLEAYGPNLGRPYTDTLKGSRMPNMKELRLDADDGVWRVAFAFDPQRQAILLCAGDKSGVEPARFYKRLISLAEERFGEHLARLERKI
ncbi:MAG: type II toxin-antitoxin system RelE/ParE family toxin [Pseudomonadota bacterium]